MLDGVVQGQGIAVVLLDAVTLLDSVVGPTSVTVAIEVPVLGCYVVAAVYIPPVQRGFAS